jgi:hypothetical protein
VNNRCQPQAHSRHNMRGVASLLCLLAVGGCATTPVSPARASRVPPERLFAFQDPAPDRTATIVVTRDRGMLGSGCYSSFFLNSVHAARFDVGETATFHVPPGETLLRNGVDLEGRALCGFRGKDSWTQRETILRAGETKLLSALPRCVWQGRYPASRSLAHDTGLPT